MPAGDASTDADRRRRRSNRGEVGLTNSIGFPVRVVLDRTDPIVILRDISRDAFADAFVHETTDRTIGREFISPLFPSNGAPCHPADFAPAGIIFHVSKSGSTLISQVLKCRSSLTVYSQPSALDDILMPPHCLSEDALVKAIRALGLHLSRHAGGNYILKMASWHVLFCRMINVAFPQTPWIFSIREPIEVFVSAIEDPDPSVWYRYLRATNNPFAPYIGGNLDAHDDSPGAYFSRFYESFCNAIEQQLPGQNGLVVDYTDLPSAIWQVIGPHFGLQSSPCDIARMVAQSTLYSKSPLGETRVFIPDAQHKRERAQRLDCSIICRTARPPFERLLSARPRSLANLKRSAFS